MRRASCAYAHRDALFYRPALHPGRIRLPLSFHLDGVEVWVEEEAAGSDLVRLSGRWDGQSEGAACQHPAYPWGEMDERKKEGEKEREGGGREERAMMDDSQAQSGRNEPARCMHSHNFLFGFSCSANFVFFRFVQIEIPRMRR